jgi:1-pyrroline-5-carboxylate dehydrogenase
VTTVSRTVYGDPTPGRHYAPSSVERATITAALVRVRDANYDVPNVVGTEEIRTGRTAKIVVPHAFEQQLGQAHHAGADVVEKAIAAATEASHWWGETSPEERAAPFLHAADMLEHGPWRDLLNAATMLELSKTMVEADGDATCETVDLIRANVANMAAMTALQPNHAANVTNHVDYRPLEGFVFAVSPFNFASMSQLAFGPALLGNTLVWKPAESASLVAHLSLQLLKEAGLPPGVINLVHGNGAEIGAVALAHRDLAAVAFTGSTETFRHIWRTVGTNIGRYRGYPRIVGETGGKGFVVAHPSAEVESLAVACIRGAFAYQGQKCSAASRLYAPSSLWPALRKRLVELTRTVVVGDPARPETYVGAVINARQFSKHDAALARARAEGAVIAGGGTDGTSGWFVDPTILEVGDPQSHFLTEELFAPVLTVYVYEDARWAETLRLVDQSTPYGLTGSVFATDESAIAEADAVLRYTAGNYHVNDKPTGAVVGQQPFGGARASGTNDKVGTVWNSIRFASPRAVKRNQQPPLDFRDVSMNPS